MHRISLVFLCLACAGNGGRVQTAGDGGKAQITGDRYQGSRFVVSQRPIQIMSGLRTCYVLHQAHHPLRAIAVLFLALEPPATFNPPGLGVCSYPSNPATAGWRTGSSHRISAVSASEQGSEELPLLDVAGLKKETSRQYSRAVKKVAKKRQQIQKAEAAYEKFMNDPDPSEEDIEKLPNSEGLDSELQSLQERLTKLAELEEVLKKVKTTNSERYKDAVELATFLEVGDSAPIQPAPKNPPKKKGSSKQPPPRKPYFVYTSADNLEIRVGRRAEDNDELSCNPHHRDGKDWWMHVSGSPGSHVVIRYHDDIQSEFPETVKDAALLAVANSKGNQRGTTTVSLVRARQVSKPSGAKPGLVRLSGDISLVRINAANQKERLERLMTTKRTG